MTVRWLNEENKTIVNLNEVEEEPEINALGSFLGAAPYPVGRWLPYEAKNWDQLNAEQQAQAKQIALAQEAQYNSQVAAMKNRPGACDATVPGALAGALREYLLENGGVEANVGTEEDTFGPKEMDEWIRVFGQPPTAADAGAAVGTVWFGSEAKVAIKLSTFCKSVKVPTKAVQPVPQTPPPVETTVPASTKKSSNLGWLLLAGSTLGALAFALMPKVKKLPPQRGARTGNPSKGIW